MIDKKPISILSALFVMLYSVVILGWKKGLFVGILSSYILIVLINTRVDSDGKTITKEM